MTRFKLGLAVFASMFVLAPAASAAGWNLNGGTITNPLAFAGAQTVFSAQNGNVVNDVAVADLNGDGKQDIVGSDYEDGTAVVLLNQGGGNFSETSYPIGLGASDLVLADVNGDGYPDIVALTGGHTVAVLLNNGDGTFGTPTTYNLYSPVAGLAVTDLNGDGKPDIVAGLASPNNDLVVLLNNGGGAFTEENQGYPTGEEPGPLVAGDFNHDGHQDIAFANLRTGNVTVLDGDGQGGFGSPQTFSAGTNPISLAVGDFNGDGYPDLAVVDCPNCIGGSGSGNNEVQVLLNNGSSSTGPSDQFAPASLVANYSNADVEGVQNIAVGDLNGDGIPDLALSDGSDFYVYPGNGDGTFGSPVTVPSTWNDSFAIGDLNGDGAPDFAMSTADGGTSEMAVNLHVLPPTNGHPPTLNTNALVNQTLYGDSGEWNALATPDTEWQVQRCDQNGANCVAEGQSGWGQYPQFDPTTDDVGSRLELQVTGYDSAGYSAPVDSNLTNVVPTPPANTTAPTITGETSPSSASVGQTIRVGGDTWNMKVNRSYSWWICPPGDSDPSAWQSKCWFPLSRNQSIAVPATYVGDEIEGIVAASNSKYGTSYANTGLLTLVGITPNSKTLRAGTFNQAYSVTLNAVGGTAPWSWSVASGNLPPGVSLDSSAGTVSGTPTAAGIYTFTVQATDSSTPTALVATRTYSLTVNMAMGPSPLPKATANQPYAVNLTVAGGTAPYSWALAPGSNLPPGLSLDSSSGAISGTPTTGGSYQFTVQVTDSSDPALTSSHKYDLHVQGGSVSGT